MKIALHANGNGTYVWDITEIDLDFQIADIFNITERLDYIRQSLSGTDSRITDMSREVVITVLTESFGVPLSTNEIVERSGADYLEVRSLLLELLRQNLVTRSGKGGRNGFQYRLGLHDDPQDEERSAVT